MRKNIALGALFLILLQSEIAYPQVKQDSNFKINSRYAVVIDQKSGRILFEKDSRRAVPMASTTKIMTAIVALENSNLNDEVVISKRASSIHGSSIGLKTGQKLTMEELLYGLMMRSGNDCAIAIAEHISGSAERFAELMNSKAFNIGAFNTRFTTPHGLDSGGHFTTAYDLALITRYALNNETFCRIVSSKEAEIEGVNGPRKFININKILWKVEGADGVKTGYTGKAGKCLVSSASRDSMRVICVVLNSSSRWDDSAKLLEHVLKKYKYETLEKKDGLNRKVRVPGSGHTSVRIGLDDDLMIPVSEDEKGKISVKIDMLDSLILPVFKGQQVGRFVVYASNKEIYSVPLRAMEDVNASLSRNIVEKIIDRLQTPKKQ